MINSRTRRTSCEAWLEVIAATLRNPRITRPVVGRELRQSLIVSLDGSQVPRWHATVEQLAEALYTALYVRPDTPEPASPLQQAEDAKRRRDLGGELEALLGGARQLESSPWYPARAGDLLHIHYEQAGGMPAYGETYAVEPIEDWGGELGLRLLHHTWPEDSEPEGLIGCFAPGDTIGHPLDGPWMEAGPHRLTIVRHGRIVHPAQP